MDSIVGEISRLKVPDSLAEIQALIDLLIPIENQLPDVTDPLCPLYGIRSSF